METLIMAPQDRKTQQLLHDRRTSTRFPCMLDATLRVSADPISAPWQATVRDISPKGVGLVLEQAFSLGTWLTIQVSRPCGDRVLVVEAQVVYTHPDPQGWVHGCRFV